MDLRDSPEDAAFRAEARSWLEENLVGDFAEARGLGRHGPQHEGREVRLAWERQLGEAGWTCVGWPTEWAGRGATMSQQVIWNEEYVRADAPARVGSWARASSGPTLIAYGTEAQKRRFLEPIRLGTELWCQGYSEPDAGSDLANVQTKAVLDGDEWVINGQKVWTSLRPVVRLVLRGVPHRSATRLGTRASPTFSSRWTSPGIEVRPITPGHRDGRVQRGVLRRRPDRLRHGGRRGERRMAGGPRHVGLRTRGRAARRHRRSSAGSSTR